MSVPLPALFTAVPSFLRVFPICCENPPASTTFSHLHPASALLRNCCQLLQWPGVHWTYQQGSRSNLLRTTTSTSVMAGFGAGRLEPQTNLKINKLGPFMFKRFKTATFLGDRVPDPVSRVSLLPFCSGETWSTSISRRGGKQGYWHSSEGGVNLFFF